MNPNKALWEKAISRIGRTGLRESGEALVHGSRGHKRVKVLTWGAATGRTAIPQASSAPTCCGVDMGGSSNLVERGTARPAEGLAIVGFREGRCVRLQGLAADSCDLSWTMLCAMSARAVSTWPRKWCASPRPAAASSGKWIPGDPRVAQIVKISSAYTPPPPEVLSARRWGARGANGRGL